MQRAVPALLLAVPVLLWGTTYRGTAVGAEHAPAVVFGAARAVPAGLVLLLVLLLRRGRAPRGRLGVAAGVSGFANVTIFIFAISEATALAGAANASVLINSSPLWVLVLGRVLLDERVPRLRAAGLIVGFAGVVVMFSSEIQLGAGGALLGGMALALVGGVAWAVATLAVKALSQRAGGIDPLSVTALQYLYGTPPLVLLALLAHGSGHTEWSSGTFWGAALYVAFGAVAGTIAFFAALNRLTATRTAAVQFLIPAVAVVVELARGAVPEPTTLAGMALAIAGVALANVPARAGAEARSLGRGSSA